MDDDYYFFAENSSLRLWFLRGGRKVEGIHEINQSRHEHGEFHHLYEELRRDSMKCYEYFRMDIKTFDYLLSKVQRRLLKRGPNCILNPILPVERLAVTLRYLATGASFKSLAFTFRMGTSTVSKIVDETAGAIWDVLQPIHIQVPNETMFKDISHQFFDKWNFPLCLGAIDGKHIRVKCPPNSGTIFYNYKHFFP
ncbi:uncharacterized protein [Leptinotarsa decemlineata]|uniref:uncharacterized protein n=1 Tax=Leptinotarsa decemlineata TaxID=7539 RepID=UPI003D30A130